MKQIQREAKSHPAKAIVLAVLAVVAVCYWTSLAWSWVGDGKGNPGKTCESATATSQEIAPQNIDSKAILAAELAKINTADKTEKNTQHGWKQIVEWIEKDPRTVAVEEMPGRADAFETAEETQVPEQTEEDKTKDKIVSVDPEVTPQQLEMLLSSTLVGSDGGVALIDGKTYRIGQTVTSAKDQRQTPFELSEIHANYVTLKHKDKIYKLCLPEMKLPENIQIRIKR